MQLDAFWIERSNQWAHAWQSEAKHSAKYLGRALTMEEEVVVVVFACAVCVLSLW